MEEMSKFWFSRTTTTTTTATSTSTITTTTTTTTITHFSTLLLSDFIFFFSFILSHPLYFSYFIFFSPYLLKLLSFLSPLFITTSLLLLVLLTVSPTLIDLELSNSKAGFLCNTYNTILSTLRSRLDDQTVECHLFEQLETCILLEDQYPDHEFSHTYKFKGTQVVNKYSLSNKIDEIPYNVEGNSSPYGGFSQVKDIIVCESLSQEVENKYSTDATGTESNEDMGENQDIPLIDMGFEAQSEVCSNNCGDEYKSNVNENLEKLNSHDDFKVCGSMKKEQHPEPIEVCFDNGGGEYRSKNLGKLDSNDDFKVCGSMKKAQHPEPIEACVDNGGEYRSNVKLGATNLEVCGSMRKEKEWKRTLACKLYEERQTVDGSEEGMDLLWESYETDTGKMKTKKKDKTTKKAEIEYRQDDDDDDEEDEELDGQICCLQALKFSTGKMNLGMRRPNLMRISKAMKGIGWLHHHVNRRSKKA